MIPVGLCSGNINAWGVCVQLVAIDAGIKGCAVGKICPRRQGELLWRQAPLLVAVARREEDQQVVAINDKGIVITEGLRLAAAPGVVKAEGE
jgi:hypothetical protein